MNKVKISAAISIEGSVRDCDREFSDKRENFRGLFDIGYVSNNRVGGTWVGKTEYIFEVSALRSDMPTIISILKEFGFKTKYI